MPDAEQKKDKGIELDLDAFEKQIDLEIDKLFIPSSDVPPGAEGSQPVASEDGQTMEPLELQLDQVALDVPGAGEIPQQAAQVSPREDVILELSSDDLALLDEESSSAGPPVQEAFLELEPEVEIEFDPSIEAAVGTGFKDDPGNVPMVELGGPLELELELHDLEGSAESPGIPPLSFEDSAGGGGAASMDGLELDLTVSESLEEAEVSFPVSAVPAAPADIAMEPDFQAMPMDDVRPTPAAAVEPEPSVPAMSGVDRAPELPEEAPAVADRDVLPTFLETLDVAYLSLDWDFSPENIKAMDGALANLAPYTSRTQEASSITKILRSILQHLSTRPSSVSPVVLDLLSDSLSYLKTLLLSSTPPGPDQKAELRSLLGRVQGIKSRITQPAEALSSSGADLNPSGASSRPGTEAPRAEPTSVLSRETVGELQEWMESVRLKMERAIGQLEPERKRLMQLEELLGKKAALAPIVARLGKVSSALAEHTAVLEQTEREWGGRITWLKEAASRAPEAPAPRPVPVASGIDEAFAPTMILEPGQASRAEPVHAPAPKTPQRPVPEPLSRREAVETKQEQVFVFHVSGKRFAVPVACVVKMERLVDKKARGLMNRGYATLSDFKPLFKSLKTGVVGSWSALPDKTLKSYHFLALPYDMMGDTPPPSSLAGVLLVSNGKHHGMIFTESPGAEQWTENVEPVSDSDWLTGIIRTDTPPPVEILNIDRLLGRMHGE